ncbi:MAG: cation diffusion facilitator family transporter [Smithellaceae bacterium]|nr:cation transporter [Syntrophaceae bacterium]MDD4241726.1 cation diffusion facilitator family transporter [Smithellaceae bacterium]NLX52531.1 cation transporter [Deltaproteobacteria bacterium]
MTHAHRHKEDAWGRSLLISMALNLIIPAAQIWGGIVSGSMALLSDALHNLSDFFALVINYAALIIGRRRPTPRHTFGFKRVEIFATVLSVALLYGAAFYIAIEAWDRWITPRPIAGKLVVWIALLGLAGNLLSAVLLHAGSKVNLNMKSAFLHMVADAATSLGVVVLGVVWMFWPWYRLDPLFSWLVVAMILASGWSLLKDSFLILMNATPPGINLTEIKEAIEAIDGVTQIHDLHVWNPSNDSIALAVHITVPDQQLSRVDELAGSVRAVLARRFHIDHPTLQFESITCNGGELLCQNGRAHDAPQTKNH